MEFEIPVKKKDKYEVRKTKIPNNSSRKYFEDLRLFVEEQLKNLKEDISSYFPEKVRINFGRLRHDDFQVQQILEKLNKLRKDCVKIKDYLDYLLKEKDFIICEYCGSKMYKKPVGVKFRKLKDEYIIVDDKLPTHYIYSCSNDNCHHYVEEGYIQQLENYRNIRKKLLDEGYTWVPTDWGWWYCEGDKLIKHPSMRNEEDGKSWERKFDYVNTGNGNYLKIYEVCYQTGEIEHIK